MRIVFKFALLGALVGNVCVSSVPELKADEATLVGTCVVRNDSLVFKIKNMSENDLIIADLRYRIDSEISGVGDSLIRGKEWTLLLREGSGFPMEEISLVQPGAIAQEAHDEGKLFITLRVATFDPNERKIGEWRLLRVAFEVSVSAQTDK